MTELSTVKQWPKNLLCIGKSPVKEPEAIEWAKQKGAEVVYYVPETQTAYIPAPQKVETK